jgi:hypothetical protein
MADYDYSSSGATEVSELFYGQGILMKREMKVADIIASNATLTTNGVIAAADVIQFLDMPPRFVLTGFMVRTITAEGAALTADFGIAGSTELASNFDLNQAANAITLLAVAASWGPDNVTGYAFTAADTIDMVFDAETDAGEWHVYIAGWYLY